LFFIKRNQEPTPAKKPTVVKNAKPAAKDSSSSEEDSDEEVCFISQD